MSDSESDSEHPLVRLQYLVKMSIPNFALDYKALHMALENAMQPSTHLIRRRLKSRCDATSQLLSNPSTKDTFIVVTPSDRTESIYRSGDDRDEEEGEITRFDENDVEMESTLRHPGTTMDGDVEEGVDPAEKFPYFNLNEHTSPITTVAAGHLYRLAFAGVGGVVVSELTAAYPMQQSARIDEARRALNLDCFEYKPKAVNVEADGADRPTPPTHGEMKKFEDSFLHIMERNDSDDESLDPEEDEEMLQPVEPREGSTFSRDDFLKITYQALAGNFANARCLRLRIPFENVVGIRLLGKSVGVESDDGVVLILEIAEKLPPAAFAARKVHSKYHKENAFAIVPDWTPHQVASASTRFYLYGNLDKLKQTAALMAKLCPRIATMLSSKTNESNSLKVGTSVAYASSPPFANMEAFGGPSSSNTHAKDTKGYKMSVDDVHKLLVKVGLVSSHYAAKDVSPCFKRAILMGHIKIDESSTKDTVIYEAPCCNCGEDGLECTIKNAMDQSTYGGCDYEDGGENAEIKCEDCGTGNYITELCTGKTNYDSGKFHNHCCECDDFGFCIRDYRESHCRHCGEHYFRGNMGFPCPSCGGGRSKDLSEMPPPPLTAWNGSIEHAKEVFLAQIEATCTGVEATMAKAAVLGPEEALKESDMDAPELAALMAKMASEMGEDAEECTVM